MCIRDRARATAADSARTRANIHGCDSPGRGTFMPYIVVILSLIHI